MNNSLFRLFALLDDSAHRLMAIEPAVPIVRAECAAGELFPTSGINSGVPAGGKTAGVSPRDFAIVSGLYSSAGVELSALPEPARLLYELSVNAFDAFVHAWMSELPLEGELIRFGRGILAAGRNAGSDGIDGGIRARAAAERAACDRGDPDVRLVLETAYKVWHEIHRLLGLLRFSPAADGQYTARCAPDYFVLPALGEHFTLRFGETPWVVIDEKRRVCLCRRQGTPPGLCAPEEVLVPAGLVQSDQIGPVDQWENLWRQYHRTINNESRNNSSLQRQFMPKRYWGYLPEMK